MLQRLESFDTSAIQRVSIDDALILRNVQNRLNIYGYHITELKSKINLYSLLMNRDFPLIDRIQEINHWMFEAGIHQKLSQDHNRDYETRLIEMNRNHSGKRKDGFVDSFEFPTSIVYGWITSVIVFVIEIIGKKWQVSQVTKSCRKLFRKIALRFSFILKK